MIRVSLERFLPEIFQKLHARGTCPFKALKIVGPNVYVFDLPQEQGFSPTFNVSDLIDYKKPAMIPSESFEPLSSFESEPHPECPQIPLRGLREQHDVIDRILDEQIRSTRGRDYHRFLVRQQGKPELKDSWIIQEELQQIDPDLYEHHQSSMEPEQFRI